MKDELSERARLCSGNRNKLLGQNTEVSSELARTATRSQTEAQFEDSEEDVLSTHFTHQQAHQQKNKHHVGFLLNNKGN